MAKSKYTTCAKCGLRHSTLVRHKCARPKGQDESKAEHEAIDHDLEKGGETESLDKHESDSEGGDPKEGDSEDGGESEGEATGTGTGEDEGEDEGEGEGEGEGEAEQEAPVPQMPEPETPPVVVVCTVLKFAALTAACAKNGSIEVTLSEAGLMVYGHSGDRTAYDTIPWGEFEKRSTLDGEFYVKEIIDGVDEKLIEGEATVIAEEPVEKPKRKSGRHMVAKLALEEYRKRVADAA